MENYIPWGRLDWLCNKLSIQKWHLVSCCSFEERCLSIPHYLCTSKKLSHSTILSIFEPDDSKYQESARNLIQSNRALLEKLHMPQAKYHNIDLFCKLGEVRSIFNDILERSDGKILLDISTFPKRFFFPLVNWLYNHSDVTDLVIGYTRPKQYRLDGLSFDPDPSSVIPGCATETELTPELIVIAVGYMYLGFPGILKDHSQSMEVEALLPFPPGPPNYQKNWAFLKEIEDCLPQRNSLKPFRVSALNVPQIFSKLVHLSDNGKKELLLAPYGPKTMSLAMSIFKAITNNSSVIYTQPKSYHHDYSKGVREDSDGIQRYGYYLKSKGTKLYEINVD